MMKSTVPDEEFLMVKALAAAVLMSARLAMFSFAV
jgi:hypothetical protein